MGDERKTMYKLLEGARESFDFDLEQQYDTDGDRLDFLNEPHDRIHEMADSHVPVYTASLMELAADDISIATDVPELGPAFDGEATPVNIIAANVYEAIQAALFEHANDIQQSMKDREHIHYCPECETEAYDCYREACDDVIGEDNETPVICESCENVVKAS